MKRRIGCEGPPRFPGERIDNTKGELDKDGGEKVVKNGP